MAGVHTLSQQAELGICTFYSTLRFIIHNGDLWEYKHPKKREREREELVPGPGEEVCYYFC